MLFVFQNIQQRGGPGSGRVKGQTVGPGSNATGTVISTTSLRHNYDSTSTRPRCDHSTTYVTTVITPVSGLLHC